MKKKIKAVNENRLFKLLPSFFRRPSGVLVEIAQNAARAGATRLDISVSGTKLVASDNGRGTDDPEAIVVLADSDWSAEVESNQAPAGWGLFFLLCISDSVKYRSGFGEVEIDCNRFLADGTYRENILSDVDAGKAASGFRVEADLKREVVARKDPDDTHPLLSETERLSYFPLEITVNRKKVRRRTAGSVLLNNHFTPGYDIATEYLGNPVYINVGGGTWFEKRSFSESVFAVWYGIPVGAGGRDCRWTGAPADVVIDVVCGGPVNPVLPYRDCLREDEALEKFREFCGRKAVEFCRSVIENPREKDKTRLCLAMQAMSRIGTQKEIDSLPRFYVQISTEYYSGPEDITRKTMIAERGDKIPCNTTIERVVEVRPGGKRTPIDVREVCTDKPVALSVITATRRPSWLKIRGEESEVVVAVDGRRESDSDLNNFWQKASEITVNGEKVNCVATEHDDCGVLFYYTGDPSCAKNVVEGAFEQFVFSDDVESDSRETQLEYFERGVAEDINRIRKEYRLADLLGGMRVAGIRASDIRRLTVDPAKTEIAVELADGTEKRIALAS